MPIFSHINSQLSLISLSQETVQYPMAKHAKERTVVSVVPLNGDWSDAYRWVLRVD